MKTVVTGLRGLKPAKDAKIVGATDVYQSSCWHCKAMWFQPATPESNGLRCFYCNELNYYGEGFTP
jgi:hypothetical protein